MKTILNLLYASSRALYDPSRAQDRLLAGPKTGRQPDPHHPFPLFAA